MTYSVASASQVLSRTPAVLRSLLSGLSAGWWKARERTDAWSPFEVLGHLVHGEKTDWIPRARLILEHGTSQTFTPFDMRGHERECSGRSLEQLLEEFGSLRAANVEALAALQLTEADLLREGTHPAFGRVTLAQHLATWVAHDLDHICQIARTMAKQYKSEVGPWAAYIGVMHDREPAG